MVLEFAKLKTRQAAELDAFGAARQAAELDVFDAAELVRKAAERVRKAEKNDRKRAYKRASGKSRSRGPPMPECM